MAKNKTAIISVSSILLIAMVVALVLVSKDTEENKVKDVSGSQKAISALCQTTDYESTCLKSLDGQNSTNPKDLIEVAFQVSIDYLKQALQNSTALKEAQNDPRGKGALDACGELANCAIEDFHRSFDKFASFDITKVDDVLLDLKTWLSGAMTQQETCIDGFEDVPGDSGEKMKKILTTSMQMTSNALAMVAEIATFLESMGMQSISSSSRRLLSQEIHVDEFPEWMNSDRRELIAAQPQKIKPDAIVAKDGSGDHRTINDAIKALPKNSNKTVVLYIKQGVYTETVRINSTLTHLMMIGDGPTKTKITGSLNFADGTGTYHTATVAVQADDFMARDIAFENSAGPSKHQAVALRVSGDKAIFYNCQMDGYQDTLYAHAYRQFYRDCKISGTIDFIFGDSASVFQGCTMLIRKPLSNQQNIVTAQGRKDLRQPTGLVLQNCTFTAHAELQPVRHEFKSYLGRPWKEFSRTIIMESFLDDLIHPDGWLPWMGNFALNTLFYTEFNNRGPASPKAKRVQWEGVKELPSHRIQRFTASAFLDGNRWIPPKRVPYSAGFIFSVPKEDPNIKYSPVVPEENKDLGLTTNIDKEAFAALKPNITTSPPPPVAPPPVPTPPLPTSNIAAAPQGFAAAPSPLDGSVPIIPFPTGEVIIDLSPSPEPSELAAPAPAPVSTPDALAASPSLSPSGSTPQSDPAVSPTGSTPPQSDLAASTPQSAPAASPSGSPLQSDPAVSPSGSTPQSDPAASPSLTPTGGSAPSPQAETNSSPISPTGASGAAASTPTTANAPQSSTPLAEAPSDDDDDAAS